MGRDDPRSAPGACRLAVARQWRGDGPRCSRGLIGSRRLGVHNGRQAAPRSTDPARVVPGAGAGTIIDAMNGSPASWTRSVVAATADLVLPSRCATCPSPGAPLCRTCRAGVRAVGFLGGPRESGPQPAPPGMPRCWAAARLDGPLRTAVTAYKDQGRRDLEPVLGELLAAALASALAGEPVLRRAAAAGSRVLVVPMPTSRASRRRRGDDPVRVLAGHALARAGAGGRLVLAPTVRHARAVADQAGLGREERTANLHGALVLDPHWRDVVHGAPCVLLDDVVTTGASLTEAARVLRDGGAQAVLAATVAATARRGDRTHHPCERLPLVGR